jgi:primosomal protein N' (replication factor Y) (superfamily II helicase)
VWRGVATGQIRVVVGARSALFLPFRDLGLIVVDEEHDLAYKQEDRVFYNARDMAVVRGHLAGFPVVLSSATPSIESRVNADAGPLPADRAADRYRAAGCPRSRPSICARTRRSAAASSRPPLVADRAQALAAASRRCSSSTAAAMPR